MKTKSCILFACSIFSDDKIYVLKSFLEKFKTMFSDVDIYIGINYNSIPQVEEIITSYNLNCVVARLTEPLLYTHSDASAYQLAISLLMDSNIRYDYYWFVHTKGGVNSHSENVRNWYFNHYYDHRHDVEQFLQTHDGMGSYGLLGMHFNIDSEVYRNTIVTDVNIPIFENTILPQLPCTRANFFYIHTLYTITRKPMDVFFNMITESWFLTKLDTYYFEGVFPAIVSRCGCYPYVQNMQDMNGVNIYLHSIEPWIQINNLHHYNSYLSLNKWDSIYKQLNPNLTLC